jgi:NMD protein affecting ribosome stability and mRNA decay
MIIKEVVKCQDCHEEKTIVAGLGFNFDNYICTHCFEIRRQKVRAGTYRFTRQEKILLDSKKGM